MVALKRKVKDFAREEGADVVGFTSSHRVEGERIAELLPDASSVVVVGMRLSKGACILGEDGEPFHPRMYTVDQNAIMEEIRRVALKISKLLEDKGFKSVIVGDFPLEMSMETKGMVGDLDLRKVAVEAGLGEIGENNLLLTPEFGPRVVLAAVVTTAEFSSDARFEGDLCDECMECVEICPIGALKGKGKHDSTKCVRNNEPYGLGGLISFLAKRVIGKDEEDKIDAFRSPEFWSLWQGMAQGGVLECGKCLRVCPKGISE